MSLAALTSTFVGRPYRLGRTDCFSAILGYIEACGYPAPREFEGQTRDSYAALFLSQPQEAKAVMVRLIDSLLPSLTPAQAFAGDILLLRLTGTDNQPFLAIDGGNGHALAAVESRGVCQLSLRNYTVERVWRCQQRSL